MAIQHRAAGQMSSQTVLELDDNFASAPGKPSMKRVNFVLSSEETGTVKTEGRHGDEVALYAALGSMILFVGYTWLIVLSSDPFSLKWFAFHPTLQTLSIGFFTYGILTLQPTSQPKTKAAGLTRHQLYILFAGVPLIVVGTWVEYHYKNVNGRAHFTTWHGLLGIFSVVWLVVQLAVGGGSVWFGGAAFGGGMKAKGLWKYHRMSGYLLFPLFLYVAHLGGGWSGFSVKNTDVIMRVLSYTIAPIAAVVAISSRARLSKMGF